MMGPSFRVLIVTSLATAVLGCCLLPAASKSARGGDDGPPGKRVDAPATFIADLQRTLKDDDLRLIALANQVLEDPGAPGAVEDQLDRLRIDAMKAEGEYQYATFRREIAEMALKEYTEATLPHALTAADGALGVAQAEQVAAREMAKRANDDTQKIVAQLGVLRAAFSLEQAESEKKVLVQYTKSKLTKDLGAQLEKAISEERARKAEWELLKRRIEKMQKAATAEPSHTDVENRIIALLDRAAPIEELVQAMLARIKKEPKLVDTVASEVRSRTDELGAIIDEAEAVKASADFDRLKQRIQRAARPGLFRFR